MVVGWPWGGGANGERGKGKEVSRNWVNNTVQQRGRKESRGKGIEEMFADGFDFVCVLTAVQRLPLRL